MESELTSSAIPIKQLYLNAKYAWDQLQTRKDIYGPNHTNFYFVTEVVNNVNYSTSGSIQFLPIFYTMYKMTNDSAYLIFARDVLSDALTYTSGHITLSNTVYDIITGYDWKQDIKLDNSHSAIEICIPLALEDSYFSPFFEDLVSDSHEIFWSPDGLIYPSRNSDGEILGSDCHLTWSWGGSVTKKITQLLWLAELTGNLTYKDWADETIDKIWSYSSNYFLLPRNINPVSGAIKDTSIAHYDMAGWLCALELAYFLNDRSNSAGTGTHTYFDLINKAAQGVSNHMWHSTQRWGYKANYNSGGTSDSIPEMNAIYVDYAMILAYEITKNEIFLTKAITDFENEFMGTDPTKPNGVLMSNSLLIHSPSTFGRQSQYIGSSNIMVARTASLIYKYTQNVSFLQKAKYHYNQLTSTHKFEKGYTDMLDTYTLLPYASYQGSAAKIFDSAATHAILALPSSFIPSENVFIDWGYGLTTTMPDGYGMPGAFTGVSIDIGNRRVHLKSVSSNIGGSVFIYFAEGSTIQSVLIDKTTPYSSFDGNLLLCEEGTHSYTITFTEPSDITTTLPTTHPITTITPSTSSSTPSSIDDSTDITDYTTMETTTHQTGFSVMIFAITVVSCVIYLFNRRRRQI